MLLTVPVKPAVRRFLIKEFGKEPIQVRANSDLGGILLLAFAKGENIPLDALEITEDELPEHSTLKPIQFQLGEKFTRKALAPESRLLLTNALTSYFRTCLYYYTIGRRTLFDSEMSAVKLFRKQYGIPEEELSEESAIKIAQRERKERADFRRIATPERQVA